jgi:Zn-finger nucleic acid-binding protein
MKCPIDNTDLVMTERSSIEIDYCPKCRGVWLDRGELDKIIERNAQSQSDFATPPKGDMIRDRDFRENERRYRDDDDYYKHKKHGKRKSLLDDLFDF